MGDKMFGNALLLSAALVLTGASESSAGTITFFDNYPFNQYYGYFVCGNTTCGGRADSPALQFVPGTTGTTTKVSVPVSSYMDYSAEIRVMIRADNNGIPGKVLAKRNVTAPACCVSTSVKMTVNLTTGTAYWLEVAPRSASAYALWQLSNSSDMCTVAENYSGRGWTTYSTTQCPAGKIVGD
jgi:hypothetical protein